MTDKRQRRTVIPETMNDFDEYMNAAIAKVKANCALYGINPDKLTEIVAVYEEYTTMAALVYNPVTSIRGMRTHRRVLQNKLLKLWRTFIAEYIRCNTLVPEADLVGYGVLPKDIPRLKIRTPNVTGVVAIKRIDAFRFSVKVYDRKTRHMKNPANANGSSLYVAITEVGKMPLNVDEYVNCSFSTDNRHEIKFPDTHAGKQANIYACYTNVHGRIGPKGPVSWVVIT
jgi:hypothetical protein